MTLLFGLQGYPGGVTVDSRMWRASWGGAGGHPNWRLVRVTGLMSLVDVISFSACGQERNSGLGFIGAVRLEFLTKIYAQRAYPNVCV